MDFSAGKLVAPDDDRMKIAALIEGLPIRVAPREGDVNVSSIVEDSRQVQPGSLFVARTGLMHDGSAFIADAIAAGAVAVLCDGTSPLPEHVACLTADDVPAMAARLAERMFGHPADALKLIGVTGTNGKTTVAHLVHHLLNDNKPQPRRICGLIGTVEIDDGAERTPASLTTPPAMQLSRWFRAMVDNGCTACVMETSSHALQQQRTAALSFDAAVFTNITGDHLDYHGSMSEYIAAKARLFSSLKPRGTAIINIDDPNAQAMIDAARGELLTCSLADRAATFFADIVRAATMHTDVMITGPFGAFDARLPLCGRHNVMNALQAIAVAYALNVDIADIRAALRTCSAPPGRLQPVSGPGDPFAVYVDYAHTDDALENVLAALRPLVADGGVLRVVFGCGGDRDRTKRPRMARAACRGSDEVIITSDNPRTEDPQAIVDEVHQGVPVEQLSRVQCIVDRRQAIHTAIKQARPDDVVLIAGKGHETYQIIGTQKHDFDDRVIAAEALAAHRNKRELVRP